MSGFKVYWDNGASGCGTFPQVYETEAEAQAFADRWVAEMCAQDGLDPEGPEVYFAEVVPAERICELCGSDLSKGPHRGCILR